MFNKKFKIFNPIIFYTEKKFKFLNSYKLIQTKKLINKYKIFKKFHFILFYSDLVLIDKNFLFDLILNSNKVKKYLELNKKNFLFFYYNKKIYNYKFLFILIKFYKFLYSTFYYFLNIKSINLKLLKLYIYIKNKKCQQ